MISNRIRIRAITLTLGLLAAAGVSLVTPGVAHASCLGPAAEFTHSLVVNGTVYVTENPVNGTCNNNNFYQSNFNSQFAGWRASMHIQNNGLWTSHYGGYDINAYLMAYNDNNSNSLITLCLNNVAETAWYCGWGNSHTLTGGFDHTYAGANFGF